MTGRSSTQGTKTATTAGASYGLSYMQGLTIFHAPLADTKGRFFCLEYTTLLTSRQVRVYMTLLGSDSSTIWWTLARRVRVNWGSAMLHSTGALPR